MEAQQANRLRAMQARSRAVVGELGRALPLTQNSLFFSTKTVPAEPLASRKKPYIDVYYRICM